MKTVPYSTITVTMISNEAGVNRKTFYAHYHNKDELMFAMVYDMFDELFGCFMYWKESCELLDEKKVQEDARSFLEKVRKPVSTSYDRNFWNSHIHCRPGCIESLPRYLYSQ